MIDVFAIGSPFGEDRIAWELADQLVNEKTLQNTHVNIVKLDRPGPNLINQLKKNNVTIFIDAALMDADTKIQIINDIQALPTNTELHSSHGFGLAATLQLADSLNLLPNQWKCIAVNILLI